MLSYQKPIASAHLLKRSLKNRCKFGSVQVRTLVQQRDAAQNNTKTLAAALLQAQTKLDKLYIDGGNKPAPAKKDSESSSQLTGWHSIWHPSSERNAKSTNQELARILKEVAVNDEVAVAISNSKLAADGFMLEFWYTLTVCIL
jgi:hypothetical protein